VTDIDLRLCLESVSWLTNAAATFARLILVIGSELVAV
jgi:hypothetical protein